MNFIHTHIVALVLIIWPICFVLIYAITLNEFTSNFPSFNNFKTAIHLALLGGLIGPIGLLAAIFMARPLGLRIFPLTRLERWSAFQQKFPGLGYEYFDND